MLYCPLIGLANDKHKAPLHPSTGRALQHNGITDRTFNSKALLLGIASDYAMAATNLTTSVKRGEYSLRKATMRKESTYGRHFDSSTFALKTIAFSICGDFGEDKICFFDHMAHHRVDRLMGLFDEKNGRRS